jgi:anti-sigma factor ChrR (cupin superfamily)
MRLNADFDKRVVVHSQQLDWQNSPMQGVFRRPLERIGDEVARATSIVKYLPGSHFSPHVHTGGEEFLVLEGVFEDEHGDYPVGSYSRNPPQSSHTPGSTLGCVIFVKLWQFQPDDSIDVRLNTGFMGAVELRDHLGVSVIPLYKDSFEEVSIAIWEANTEIILPLDGGG